MLFGSASPLRSTTPAQLSAQRPARTTIVCAHTQACQHCLRLLPAPSLLTMHAIRRRGVRFVLTVLPLAASTLVQHSRAGRRPSRRLLEVGLELEKTLARGVEELGVLAEREAGVSPSTRGRNSARTEQSSRQSRRGPRSRTLGVSESQFQGHGHGCTTLAPDARCGTHRKEGSIPP